MKGKSLITILGGILLAIISIFMFRLGDIVYGIAAAIVALVLLYLGLIRNRHKQPAYKDFNQSHINSHFNISGSDKYDKQNKN